MDRPRMKVRNPVGPGHPVYVHEQVLEDVLIPGSTRTTRVIAHNPGDRITLEEAERLGVPMLDEERKPVPGAPQKPKPKVETQEVQGPRVRDPIVRRARPRPKRVPGERK